MLSASRRWRGGRRGGGRGGCAGFGVTFLLSLFLGRWFQVLDWVFRVILVRVLCNESMLEVFEAIWVDACAIRAVTWEGPMYLG